MLLLKPRFLLVALVLFLTIGEGESRRSIVKGRKALTRSYLKGLGIPAWVIVILVALGELALGGALFILMKKLVLDPPLKPRFHQILSTPSRNSPAPESP